MWVFKVESTKLEIACLVYTFVKSEELSVILFHLLFPYNLKEICFLERDSASIHIIEEFIPEV